MKLLSPLALLAASALMWGPANASTIITDFENGTVEPFSFPNGISGFVGASPSDASNQTLIAVDTTPGFQTALNLNRSDFTGDDSLLPLFQQNRFLEFDVLDFAFEGGNGMAVGMIIQTQGRGDNPAPFEFFTVGPTRNLSFLPADGVASINYAENGGLERFMMVDQDRDGRVDADWALDVFILQQHFGPARVQNFVEYDNIRVRLPEPTTASLAGLIGVVAAGVRRRS